MAIDLFEHESRLKAADAIAPIAPGAVLLRRFVGDDDSGLLSELSRVTDEAPFRQMITPGGYKMSVAMTNCGTLGWFTDKTGYRYATIDPESGKPWPRIPESFTTLAARAASAAGFDRFVPDACLINRYDPGAKLSLHQDKDERDFTAPIVSVSLGLPATFLFGGDKRADEAIRVPVEHGDVVVWGGPARLRYHGVSPVKAGVHPALGAHRINLTFRKAG